VEEGIVRTNPEYQHAAYNWIGLPEAARRLGVKPDHVLALGGAGEVEVEDFRLPGAARGVYRINPASVDAFIARRKLGSAA
jgi:hypothetical protein